MKYQVSNNGKYTLDRVAAANGAALAQTSGFVSTMPAASHTVATTNGSYQFTFNNAANNKANGKTLFLVAPKNGTGTVYTVYEGIKNGPSITTSAAVNSIVKKGESNEYAAAGQTDVFPADSYEFTITVTSEDGAMVKSYTLKVDAVNYYTVTFDVSEAGKAIFVVDGKVYSDGDTLTVAKDKTVSFTVKAADGKTLSKVEADSTELTGFGGVYTQKVTADVTIKATVA